MGVAPNVQGFRKRRAIESRFSFVIQVALGSTVSPADAVLQRQQLLDALTYGSILDAMNRLENTPPVFASISVSSLPVFAVPMVIGFNLLPSISATISLARIELRLSQKNSSREDAAVSIAVRKVLSNVQQDAILSILRRSTSVSDLNIQQYRMQASWSEILPWNEIFIGKSIGSSKSTSLRVCSAGETSEHWDAGVGNSGRKQCLLRGETYEIRAISRVVEEQLIGDSMFVTIPEGAPCVNTVNTSVSERCINVSWTSNFPSTRYIFHPSHFPSRLLSPSSFISPTPLTSVIQIILCQSFAPALPKCPTHAIIRPAPTILLLARLHPALRNLCTIFCLGNHTLSNPTVVSH
jgi:hypothetical protein